MPIHTGIQMSKIEGILTLLASTDSVLRNEIIELCSLGDANECQKVFLNIRKNLFPTRESKVVQELCISKGIKTSADYSLLRLKLPELPIDPRPQNTTWYNYLHSTDNKGSC